MKLVVLDGYASNPGDLGWDKFLEFGDLTVYDRTADEEVIPRSKDADILLINKAPLTRAVFDACKNLKLVAVLATGYNVVDLDAARDHGVTVCNVPGYSTYAVAQLTFALLLELCHRVGDHSAACHGGQWERCPDFCFWNYPLTELAGKTFGIVGYGAIGHTVATIAQALGMRVLLTSRTRKPVPEGMEFVSLEELLARSDVVSLHCPLTAENTRMINAATLQKMKDGAILINTARGGLVEEAAVRAALEQGKLGGFAADVVSAEPIRSANPLLGAPNCILTPHIAWAPLETRQRLHDIALENIRAFLEGRPQNVVS